MGKEAHSIGALESKEVKETEPHFLLSLFRPKQRRNIEKAAALTVGAGFGIECEDGSARSFAWA